MPAAQNVQKKPITHFLIPGGVIAAGAATYFGVPALFLIWVALLLSAFTHPAPIQGTGTGVSKTASEAAIAAADPGYARSLKKYRYWSSLKMGLIAGKGMIPGWPPKLTWVVAACAAALAYLMPVAYTGLDPAQAQMIPWLNAYATFATLTALPQARRETLVRGDVMDAVHFGDAAAPLKQAPHTVIAPGVGAAIAALVITSFAAPLMTHFGIEHAWIAYLAAPILAGTLALMPSVSKRVQAHFLAVAGSREHWEQRFITAKIDPPHHLLDFTAHGTPEDEPENYDASALVVETFTADPRTGGSRGTDKLLKELEGLLGGAWKATIAPVDSEDSNGQPIPGTVHSLKFDIIRFPNGNAPDVTSWDTDEAQCIDMFRYAFAEFSHSTGEQIRLDEFECISQPPPQPEQSDQDEPANPEPDHGRLWMVTWSGMGGEAMRQTINGSVFPSILGTRVLVDHRFGGGSGVMVFGDFDAPLTESSPLSYEQLELIVEEDTWNHKWIEVMKQGTNPPRPEFATRKIAELSNGTQITSLGFVTRNGMGYEDFFKIEPKIPTMLDSAPFASLAGWPLGQGRPGERHPQAFALRWGTGRFPSRPDDVVPVPGSEAPAWVLAHLLHQGFIASKLARPELVSAEPLTTSRGRKHIWRLRVRLYGGVTLADVRKNAVRIRQVWASDWLRIAEAEDGCEILVGCSPTRADFISPRIEQQVDSLDWEQVFVDSGLEGLGGKVPRLLSSTRLKNNQDVKVLTFDGTGTGITFDRLGGNRKKLETNSSNGWVDPQAVPGKPNQFVLRVAETDPMPVSIAHEWEKITTYPGLAIGVDLEGATVGLNPKKDPHLLFSGMSGAGKSVSLQTMVASGVLHEFDMIVIDPSKDAADFKFAEPWLTALGTDIFDAGAIMVWAYEQVKKRKRLNSQYGTGHIKDLPADVRPQHMVIVMDEFTSLMIADDVPPITGDPDMDAQREKILAVNRVRAEIGTLSGRIAREARSAGVTLVFATQALKADTLSKIRGAGDLKDNLSRSLLGKASQGQLAAALKNWPDAPSLGEVVPKGRGVFETNEDGFIIYQSYYHPDEQDYLRAELEARRGLPTSELKVDLSAFQPERPSEGPAVVDLDVDPSAPSELIELDEMDLGDLELDMDAIEDTIIETVEPEAAEPELDWEDEDDLGPVEPEVEAELDWDDADDLDPLESQVEADLEWEDEQDELISEPLPDLPPLPGLPAGLDELPSTEPGDDADPVLIDTEPATVTARRRPQITEDTFASPLKPRRIDIEF